MITGLLTKAGNAKNAAEIGEEKEIISLSIIEAKAEKYNENLDETKFQEALDKNSKVENKAIIAESDEEGFIVQFEGSKRYYEIDNNGKVDFIDIAGGGKKLTIECKDSNKNTLATKTYTIIKNEYSKTLPAIEGYIPEQETISGEITGDTTKEVLYYYVIPETQMVFTGLDSSGNITTDSSQIVSYMVGNNSSTNGNGLVLAPTVLSALIIPETHEGKPIIKVGNNGFRDIKKIGILNIGNSVTSIGQRAIYTCTAMKKLIIGSGLNSIGTSAFAGCGALKTIIYNNETNVIRNIRPGSSWIEIQINEDNTKLKVVDNIIYSIDGATMVKVPDGKSGKLTLLEETTKIGEDALRNCTKITEVNIGNNVTSIGNNAMYGCSGMTKVTIGRGLTSIGTTAFSGCSSLKTVIIDSSTIATNLSAQNSCGRLVYDANIVYTKTTPGAYILNNFSETTSDLEGYTKYVKN